MAVEKKFLFKNPELYDADGNLNKRWFVSYYPEKGKRIRVYGTINQAHTLEDRYEIAQKLITDILGGAIVPARSQAELMIETLEARKPILRKKTYQTYMSKLTVFRDHVKENKITRELCENFFRYLLNDRSGSKTTYNAYLNTLAEFYRLTFQDTRNPFKSFEKLRNVKTPAQYFTRFQVRELKAEIGKRHPQLWLYCQFIFYCFIRPGELRLLRVYDIQLEENRIVIRAEISKNATLQYVVIPAAFRPILEGLNLSQYPGRYYVFGHGQPGPEPYGVRYMNSHHQHILKSIGYDTNAYKLYSWKHTGAVMAVKAGIHIKQLQLQLRHHSLDQVNQYLRGMGVLDSDDLRLLFPAI